MDKIHFAPPKKPWNGLIHCKKPTNLVVSTMVSKWRDMDFANIHGLELAHLAGPGRPEPQGKPSPWTFLETEAGPFHHRKCHPFPRLGGTSSANCTLICLKNIIKNGGLKNRHPLLDCFPSNLKRVASKTAPTCLCATGLPSYRALGVKRARDNKLNFSGRFAFMPSVSADRVKTEGKPITLQFFLQVSGILTGLP